MSKKKTNNNQNKHLKTFIISALALMLLYSLLSFFDVFELKNDEPSELEAMQKEIDELKEENKKLKNDTTSDLNDVDSNDDSKDKEAEDVTKGERHLIYEGENELEDYIEKNNLLLIEFRASWCPYCKELEERIPDILNENDDLIILQLDIDDHEDLSQKYGIMSTPTLVLYKDQKMVDRMLGALPNEDILEWIDES